MCNALFKVWESETRFWFKKLNMYKLELYVIINIKKTASLAKSID